MMFNETQWQHFLTQGYVRLGQVISPETAETLCQRADDLVLGNIELPEVQLQLDTGAYDPLGEIVEQKDFSTLLYRKIQGLEKDALFRSVLEHSIFAQVCGKIYGPHTPISIFRAMIMNKPAGQGTHLPWHQDGGDVWKLDRDPLLTMWIALDPATQSNGCVQIIPRSHHLGLLSNRCSTLSEANAEKYCKESDIEYLELKPGEGVILHNWLIHRSGINQTNKPRRGFTACYMDGRSLSRLSGNRYPMIFGTLPSIEEDYPFIQHLRCENDTPRLSYEEAMVYAQSLEQKYNILSSATQELEQYARSLEATIAKNKKRSFKFINWV